MKSLFFALFCVLYTKRTVGYDFLVMGDWGGQDSKPYYTPAEKDTAAIMGEVASQYDAQMVWALGDNFYKHGIPTNAHDPRFQQTFEDVFTAQSLENIPFYVVAGNHDWEGNVSAQISYTQHSTRWKYPDYYYNQIWTIKGSDNVERTLEVVMIDTVMLTGTTYDSEYCEENNIVNCKLQPTGPENVKAAQDQWKWIDQTLRTSTSDFLMVAGHYPVWSIGENGPNVELVSALRPMLINYNVTLYLNGHEHSMQYLQENEHPDLGYVVTGAAHACNNSTAHINDVPKNSSKYWGCDDGGFVRIHVDTTIQVFFYLGDSNTITYTTHEFAPRSQ